MLVLIDNPEFDLGNIPLDTISFSHLTRFYTFTSKLCQFLKDFFPVIFPQSATDHRWTIAGHGWAPWDRHGHRWAPWKVKTIRKLYWGLSTEAFHHDVEKKARKWQKAWHKLQLLYPFLTDQTRIFSVDRWKRRILWKKKWRESCFFPPDSAYFLCIYYD